MKALLMCSILLSVAATSVAQLTGTPSVIIGGLPAGATYPQVVSSNPPNNTQTASSSLQVITITFDQPMNVTTFYWPTPPIQDFPTLTNQPYWTNGNKTINIPVSLGLNVTYRIPLNVYDQAFKSAQGVPLPSGMITFHTSSTGGAIGAGAPGTGYASQGPGGTPGTGYRPNTSTLGGMGVRAGTTVGGTNHSTGNINTTGAGPTTGGTVSTPAGAIPAGGMLTPKPLNGAKKRATPTPHP